MQPITIHHFAWNPQWLARGVCGFSCGFFICGIYRLSLEKGWRPSIVLFNAVVLSSILIFVITRYYAGHLLLYTFPFLVFFTAYDKGFLATVLKLSPLQWLGERSYSIYLWHSPVLIFVALYYKKIFLRMGVNPPYGVTYLLIVVGSVFLISELSYRYFETTCRDYIRDIGRKRQVL
jgi:peptidoglycan/LPS O-acetylase OafA/YrhL